VGVKEPQLKQKRGTSGVLDKPAKKNGRKGPKRLKEEKRAYNWGYGKNERWSGHVPVLRAENSGRAV